MTSPWYAQLPAAETRVPCGDGQHTIRWVAGALELTNHPDAEAELVLAALGGGKPDCVRIAESWQRRCQDIELLTILPRSDNDRIEITWEVVAETRSPTRTSVAMSGPPGGPLAMSQLPPGAPPHIRQMQQAALAIRARQIDILSVLALGHEFQKRLVGSIVASVGDAAPGVRQPPGEAAPALATPALVAALAGRVAPAVARWVGVSPDDVTVAVYKGSDWGSIYATEDAVWVALPVSWLASVWACGLELMDGRFVVGVTDTGLLALGEPGGKPVEIGSET
jgi:hypothetical protein